MSKFEQTSCSQCGQDFGPGDHGFSHCVNHRALEAACRVAAAQEARAKYQHIDEVVAYTNRAWPRYRAELEPILSAWLAEQMKEDTVTGERLRENATPSSPVSRLVAGETERNAALLLEMRPVKKKLPLSIEERSAYIALTDAAAILRARIPTAEAERMAARDAVIEAARYAERALSVGGLFPVNGIAWQKLHDSLARLTGTASGEGGGNG